MLKGLQTLLVSIFFLILIIIHFSIISLTPLALVLGPAVHSQIKTFGLLFQQEKSSEEIAYIKKSFSILNQRIAQVSTFLAPISKSFDLTEAREITRSLPDIFGANRPAHYVVFFLNNYELRPGGGFIGSIGFITVKDFTVTQFEVQDVYEIDGQFIKHHEPHPAVRTYLNQPYEFLRDSNFSPDFATNAQKAIFYLQDLPAFNRDYTGAVGVTASSFENFLKLTGPITLSDFNTTVTSDNFFASTQRTIETNFFPGSKQKKSLLQSIGNSARSHINTINPSDLLRFMINELRTKHIVVYMKNPILQKLLSQLRITGTTIPQTENWFLPLDTNVGVNKADVLISREATMQIEPTSNSLIHSYSVTYQNEITKDAEVQEIYKNYFQLYLPKTAQLKSATINGADVVDAVVTTYENDRLILALYHETPPATQTKILMTYEIPHYHNVKRIQYLKQTGSLPFPLTMVYKGSPAQVKQKILESDEVLSFD